MNRRKTCLTLILLISFSAFAFDQQECDTFKKEVLKKPISEDPTAMDHPFRFAKQDSDAFEMLSKYDVKKLQLESTKISRIKAYKNCQTEQDQKQNYPFCEAHFDNYNFFRAAIFGMKHYKWSEKTKEIAKKKIFEYLDEVQSMEPAFLDVVMGINLLDMLAYDNLVNLNYKITNALKRDVETAREELANKFSESKECSVIKKNRFKEDEYTKTFAKRLVLARQQIGQK